MATRRTPSEIIAEQEAKLKRLKARAANKEAAEQPVFAPLRDLLTSYDKVEANARKTLGTGPQGGNARIESHLMWVAEIERLKDLATVQLYAIKTMRATVREAIASWVNGDRKPTKKNLTTQIKAIVGNYDDIVSSKSVAFVEAQDTRKGKIVQEVAEEAESESENA